MFGRKKKKSFIDRLTGSVRADEYDDEMDMDQDDETDEAISPDDEMEDALDLADTASDDGQLSVDVFNTEDAIVIKSMTAGVRPGDLDIDISRDMVTIHGTREETTEVSDDSYYHKELYWGSFSRNILLPEEIDVDAAEATEKNGLLTLTLPKLDKSKRTKLHVKSK